MSNKKIIEKSIEKPNINFYFKFIGKEKTKIDYEKILINIDNCFKKQKLYNNMPQNITWIRTLLSDFDEEYLEVNLSTNDINKTIKYVDKTLVLYESEENNSLLVNYEIEKNLNISLLNQPKNILNYPNYEIIKTTYNAKLEELSKLQKVNIVNLNTDDKALCLIYKLFYGEYPDFSSKNINTKIQSMLAILIEFGICLNDKISFRMNHQKIPVSLYLEQEINKLTPLGKIEVIDNSVKLSEYATKIIKIVSKSIKEFIPEDYEEVEVLPKISSIIYAKRNIVSSNAKNIEIAKATSRSENSVNEVLKLTKKIDKKINNS